MLLEGKKALVFGVANEWSLGWGVAKALHEQGATVGLSSLASLMDKRVRPLAEKIEAPFLEACDVQDDEQLRDVFAKWQERHGDVDILVHSLAFADTAEFARPFVETSREGFHLAMDVSAYSLVAMVREARPVLKPGSSVMTLTYYGAEKVVPNYKVMGIAKATLEACLRYLAVELGPDGVRVNGISPGPVRTLSASAISGFKKMHRAFPETTPLRNPITNDDVGRTAVYLASELSTQVTGEVIHVDGGFNVLGVPVAEDE